MPSSDEVVRPFYPRQPGRGRSPTLMASLVSDITQPASGRRCSRRPACSLTTWLHDKTLTTLETSLPPQFLRVHRSCLVNLHHAAHLRTEVGSRYVLVLRDGHELPVGRTRVAALRARLI